METEPKTYEELFNKLITESKSIVIEYEHKISYYKEDSYITFFIKNVNGCISDYAFKTRIQKVAKEGIEDLKKELQNLDKDDKLALLEVCRDEIWWLRNLVEDKTQIFEESEHGPAETYNFKGFTSASFKGTRDDRIKSYELSILRKASDFAIAWIEAIEDTKHKIDFLTNQIELLPDDKKIMKNKNDKYLFYSWQSDRDDLRKQIWKALSAVKKEFKKEDINLHIDSDMRNAPGGQDISTTLFSKIGECDIFIADVILTGENTLRDKNKPLKKSCNPNVLVELGYAAGKIGWGKIIMIVNTDKDKIEDLPFDIRNRSVLWYKSNDINKLQSKLKDFILSIINGS